ncbi:MAG: hypothetical protein U0984_18375 [Prosthecobacter sp.]|nr:hypothetical protein [Prosthecobacter sp.]
MLAGLDKLWKRLAQGLTPEQAQKTLEEMTTILWTGDPTQVAAAIREFLDSGHDAATGLPFRVGEKGLDFSPTMRVALLDLLERLDFGEAAEYAEILVARMEQPDEVAVALRTLMHLPEDDPRRTLATTGVQRLLQRADWKARPSGGYLEAFDVATETENPEIWRQLLALTADTTAFDGTQKGAALAAHTLAVRSPEFRALITKRDAALPMNPIIRGQLMARLDPRVPEELAALNAFVTDPAMTQEEAQAFAANFPSQRDLVGFRLVSDSLSKVRPIEEAAKLDIAANEFGRQLNSAVVTPQLRPLLTNFSKRLLQYADSAQKVR